MSTEPPQRAQTVLRVHEARKSFGGLSALDGVSFDLPAAEIHAIVGENGAGKSTLIKLIAGAHKPDAGYIELNGERFEGLSAAEARDQGVAVVYQEFTLLPDLSVAENILLGQQPRKRFGLIDVKRRRQRAVSLLDELGVSIDPNRIVRSLTVGEQQIVEVAKALAVDARILILDEPSAALPTHDVERLFGILRRLRESGASVVYISHRLAEIFGLADRVTVLKDGKSVATRDVASTTRDELVRLMVGRELSEQYPDRAECEDETVLSVRDLDADGCVWDVNFEVRRGEIVGLAGLGGSGRTTIARALVGLAHVQSGEILHRGKKAPGNPRQAAANGIVLVPEDRAKFGLATEKSIGFNIALPWLSRLKGRGGLLRPSRERELVTAAVARQGVRPAEPRLPAQSLSGGNQQKVVLAKWLAREPDVLVLDEPTRGIDVGVRAQIYEQIRDLAASGVAIVLASSDLPEILGMSDRIVVLHEGRVAGELSGAGATEEAVMRLATGRKAAGVAG